MVETLLPLVATGLALSRRGKTLLGPMDITLGRDGLTVVMGPNGAGKTTLLRSLHGLERLSAGSLQWSVPDAEARKRQAYVFQTPILLRRTVRGNLGYPLTLAGASKVEIAEQTTLWAEKIGLREALERPANRLSGGEKQKLALARALICAPELLFLDEPSTNLDGRSTREIETLLLQAQQSGTRIILATHDLGQARRLATEYLFMMNGRIHESGSGPECLRKPQTAEFQAFLDGDIIE